MNTQHATAERTDWEVLHTELRMIRENPVIQNDLENCCEPHLILNTFRQIVFANAAFRDWLGVEDPANLYGCRPGEVVDCIHSALGRGGCGTSKNCRSCGLVNAVLKSIRGETQAGKSSLTISGKTTPLKLTVFTMPVTIARCPFVLVTLSEDGPGSDEKLARQTFTMQRHVKEIENCN
jgi:hypothetical protein